MHDCLSAARGKRQSRDTVPVSFRRRVLLEDELGDAFAVPARVAEEGFGRLGALEVQVRVVLPGEADAAEDLDRVGSAAEVGVGARCLGENRT